MYAENEGFRHNIWLKLVSQSRKYRNQLKRLVLYRLLYSLIGWESIT